MNLENLISVIIGGLLVIVGQILVEILKNRKDRRSRIINISNKTREIEQNLTNDLRELALFKTHVEYWWFCHNDNSSSENYNKRYYEEHLRSQTEARKTERQIGLKIAEYFGFVNEYLSTNETETVGIVLELEKIKKIEFKKAIEYNSNDDYDKIRKIRIINDEKELKENYWKLLKPFKVINEKIYTRSKNYAQQWV